MRHSLHSPLNAAVREAGHRLSGLLMTSIHGEADMDDAANLIDDIHAICRIVDPLIEAIGEYAQSNFGNRVDLDLFRNQLLGALDGNATFTILEAARDLVEGREEETLPPDDGAPSFDNAAAAAALNPQFAQTIAAVKAAVSVEG